MTSPKENSSSPERIDDLLCAASSMETRILLSDYPDLSEFECYVSREAAEACREYVDYVREHLATCDFYDFIKANMENHIIPRIQLIFFKDGLPKIYKTPGVYIISSRDDCPQYVKYTYTHNKGGNFSELNCNKRIYENLWDDEIYMCFDYILTLLRNDKYLQSLVPHCIV